MRSRFGNGSFRLKTMEIALYSSKRIRQDVDRENATFLLPRGSKMDVKAVKKMRRLYWINPESYRAQQDDPTIASTRSRPEAAKTAQAFVGHLHALAHCTPDEVLERIMEGDPPEWHGSLPEATASR